MLTRRTFFTTLFALSLTGAAFAQVTTSGGAVLTTAPTASTATLPAGAIPGVNTTVGVPIVEQGTATQILSNQGVNTSPQLTTDANGVVQINSGGTNANGSVTGAGGANALPVTVSPQATFPAVANGYLQGLTTVNPANAQAATMLDATSVLDASSIAVYVQTLNQNSAAAGNARALTQSYRAQNLIGSNESIIGLQDGRAIKVSDSVLSTSATQLR